MIISDNRVKQITNSLYGKDIISAKSISLDQLELIFKIANSFKEKQTNQPLKLLDGKIIASCFFEASTRTRLSFESAALRLGAGVIGFSSAESTSIQKGESLHDTIKMLSSQSDLIVLRHPKEGAAALAQQIADIPVINAGDGPNQHPTQAILDLFTIQECQKKINGLSIALVGDLKYGRTIHSLIQLCSHFDVRLYLVAPEILSLPDNACDVLKKNGIRFSFHQHLEEVIPQVDILYMTRIQLERFSGIEHELVKHQYTLTTDLLKRAKPNMKVMHPLPRVREIANEIDETPFAYYFEQAANGIPVRQALLSLILNEAIQ